MELGRKLSQAGKTVWGEKEFGGELGEKEFGGELGGSWQLLLQKAGGFLNGTRILWGDKSKNLIVDNTGTVFFRLLYSSLLHLSNAHGGHRRLTLMAEYPEKFFVLATLFDFSLC